MLRIDISKFISQYITKRDHSLFKEDIENNYSTLEKEISGKSLLVIGGAGTIGSSFIQEMLKFQPAELFVIDNNENGLTELTRNLRSTHRQYIPKEYKTYPLNFADPILSKLLHLHGPFDIVANFAAHKHVRSEKDIFSVQAMIENNVLHAKSFLDTLLEFAPKHFFCVSTDKAANPVNIMGASKKLMEHVILSYTDSLKVTTARFANVAFSNGSLLDGYLQRISKKQPLSCPADIKRFFVSPEESGQICMLACILGTSGNIFFPKLSEEDMVLFKEITEDFFKFFERKIITFPTEDEARGYASSMKDDDPYPVYFFTSDTSGEKTYEEFYSKKDSLELHSFKSLGIIKNSKIFDRDIISQIVKELKESLNSTNISKQDIVQTLNKFLPDFNHIETGKNLDQKM